MQTAPILAAGRVFYEWFKQISRDSVITDKREAIFYLPSSCAPKCLLRPVPCITLWVGLAWLNSESLELIKTESVFLYLLCWSQVILPKFDLPTLFNFTKIWGLWVMGRTREAEILRCYLYVYWFIKFLSLRRRTVAWSSKQVKKCFSKK